MAISGKVWLLYNDSNQKKFSLIYSCMKSSSPSETEIGLFYPLKISYFLLAHVFHLNKTIFICTYLMESSKYTKSFTYFGQFMNLCF